MHPCCPGRRYSEELGIQHAEGLQLPAEPVEAYRAAFGLSGKPSEWSGGQGGATGRGRGMGLHLSQCVCAPFTCSACQLSNA